MLPVCCTVVLSGSDTFETHSHIHFFQQEDLKAINASFSTLYVLPMLYVAWSVFQRFNAFSQDNQPYGLPLNSQPP